ncbi:LytTR family DNA-binding domain-containing protein [Prolixibacteraceae bacterium Z1-6]|uniref:LytTR family DNA-binding domain-containing protein n=1 Tax=Draconibacterium aestuarii TaxID=2998507 RepID=A0A9X3F5K0_9BACT|nr:LytTR family DNA-binding domain-containing protein [Prolixibacteraceae bacterium Z1-6]
MRRYNAIIIDDEINLQDTLEILIHRNCPEINLVGKAKSAEEGRELLKLNVVHLIFLDISMPKETGFDFLASIPKENYVVIFTTAYEEYALKAIKANAIDYLLKPIDHTELKTAVTKATSLLTLRSQKVEAEDTYNESLNNLTQQIKSGQSHFSKITVIEKFGYRIVEINTIRFLEADSNYTIIHLSSLDKIVSSKTLGEYEKILDPDIFFRIHKSSIINLNYLKGFSNYQGAFVVMDDNTKLSISRRRFNEFREAVAVLSKSID